MLLEIFDSCVNGYKLGNEYSKNELCCQDLFFEFDTHNIRKLVTVSSKGINEFILNGEVITFEKFKNLISNKEHDIIFEHNINYTTYIIRDYNLLVNINENIGTFFLQVLVFDNSLKEFYENGLNDIHHKNEIVNISFENKLNFEPYTIFDRFFFGMKEDDFYEILGGENSNNSKKIIEIDGLLFSFKDGELRQILLDKKTNRNIDIFIGDFCITNKEEIMNAKSTHSYIERRDGRIVFRDLGFSVDKFYQEYYFFSKTLLPFWSNPHRPITSWL